MDVDRKLFLGKEISCAQDRRHQECTLLACSFGETKYLLCLWTLITDLQLLVPSLSLEILSTSTNIEEIVCQRFGPLSGRYGRQLYARFQLQIKGLRDMLDLLSCLPDIEKNLSIYLDQHKNWPSGQETVTILCNLRGLQQWIMNKKANVESTLFDLLEAHPKQTIECLISVMKLVCIFAMFIGGTLK